jgi:cardiolipin synthase
VRAPRVALEPPPKHVARFAWPAAIAGILGARYASESLRHRREEGEGYSLEGDGLDVAGPEFLRAAEALTGAPISTGNTVELHVNGDAIFPAIIDAIRSATKTITLTTYVFWKGEIAERVARELMAQAQRGLRVTVLLDFIGSVKMDHALVAEMREAGVEVALFRPPRPYAVRRMNNRCHRKLLVIDGERGMIGGVGIADEWTGNGEDPDHWRDTHVTVRGPAVRGLQGAFAENWLEATGCALVGPEHLPELPPVAEGGPMQVVRSRAGVGDTNVEALYFLAIACARETLDLTAAYFAPRPAFVEALEDAQGRGVRVRVLVPGPNIDKPFVRVAGRETYARLLAAGVEVHEYQPTMLHAKTLVVDGAWSTVGSVNFDNRSFQLQDEATLCVQSDAFAAELTRQFGEDLENAERITEDRWDGRPVRHRLHEKALALVRREI